MPDTPIDSLSTFIAEMSKLQCIGHELRPVFWFRGHAKVCRKPLPGVLRDYFINRVNEFNVRPNDPNSLGTAIETTEKSINDQFRREGASLLPSNADLGACPNICSCSRMAAGFRWALAFSASAQPCARTIPLNLPRRCRSGARSSKDCGSSRSVATRPTLSPGLATETCGSLART